MASRWLHGRLLLSHGDANIHGQLQRHRLSKGAGTGSSKIAAAMERYNPDKTWHRADDEW